MMKSTFTSLVDEDTYDSEEDLRLEIAEKLRDKGIYYFIAADIVAEALEVGWIKREGQLKTIKVVKEQE